MFKKIITTISLIFCSQPIFMMEKPFVDVQVELKARFQRKEGTAYLECYDARSFPEQGFALRSFLIKPKEGQYKDQVVGKIGVKYDSKKKIIEIGALDVERDYQRKGYGEAALRTVLGIYRSAKHNGLVFDRFWLTVGKYEDREAARNLYFKVGFEILEDLDDIGYLNLGINR